MLDFKILLLRYLARNVQTAKSVICEVYRDLERRCHEVCLVLSIGKHFLSHVAGRSDGNTKNLVERPQI